MKNKKIPRNPPSIRLSSAFSVAILLCLLFVTQAMASQEKAMPIKVGVAWQGKASMSERVLGGLQKTLADKAPQVVLDIRKDLQDLAELNTVIDEFENSKQAMVILRSNGVALLGQRGTKIPAFIGAANDPVILGAVKSFAHPGNNITGVTYSLPVKLKLEAFKQVYPEMKKYLLLVEANHPGSIIDVRDTEAAAPALGLSGRVVFCETLDDALNAVRNIKSDEVLILGIQSLLMNNCAPVMQAAGNHIVFSYSEKTVAQGALAGIMADDYRLGQILGEMLVDHLLNGKPLSAMPIETDPEPQLHLNYDTMERFKTQIPFAVTNLAKSAQMLDIIYKNLPSGIGIMRNCIIQKANDYILNLTGYTHDELVGQNSRMLYLSKEDYDAVKKKLSDEIKKKNTALVQTRWVRKDGSIRHVLLSATPLDPANPSMDTAFMVLDITDLAESKQLIEIIYKSVHSCLGIVENRVIRRVNDYMLDLLGYTHDELVGKNSRRIYYAQKDYDYVGKKLYNAIKEKKTSLIQTRWRHKDGTIRHIMLSTTPLDPANPSMDVIFTALDITDSIQTKKTLATLTFWFMGGMVAFILVLVVLIIGLFSTLRQRKQGITALRQSEERFRKLMDESTLTAIQGYSLDGTAQYWNKASERLYGFSAEEAIGRNLLDLVVLPENREKTQREIQNMARTGQPIPPSEISCLRKDGAHVPIFSSYTIVQVEGMEQEFFCLNVDLTERKQEELEKEQLQAQLIQAQKIESIGRLAGGVAHDFNNMLSVILGHTEMAMLNMDPAAPLFEDLQSIQKAARHSAELTRQLLTFARRQTVSPKILNLNKSVEKILEVLKRLIGEDIDLCWQPAERPVQLNMDPTQLEQVLTNLCLNARDAIQNTGKIILETGFAEFNEADCANHTEAIPGSYALLAVSDNGCGINKEMLPHIFEPFFTTKEAFKGTGLSMSTVYGIVKQNQGFITVYSEPGQGSTFKIYLPCHDGNTRNLLTRKQEESSKRGQETLLLVEDEPTILNITQTMLETQGYTVLPAGSPSDAIALAQAHKGKIHLLITDMIMPEMNGKDLAKALLSLFPEMKYLFMSGYTTNIIAHHAVLDKEDCFIQKPFLIKDLVFKIRKALE